MATARGARVAVAVLVGAPALEAPDILVIA